MSEMIFALPSDTSNGYDINGMPFASYNPNSYCPNATQATIQLRKLLHEHGLSRCSRL